eukprot:scaffold43685_cov130-Amphora_coffeaeformis.AAC.1
MIQGAAVSSSFCCWVGMVGRPLMLGVSYDDGNGLACCGRRVRGLCIAASQVLTMLTKERALRSKARQE